MGRRRRIPQPAQFPIIGHHWPAYHTAEQAAGKARKEQKAEELKPMARIGYSAAIGDA